MVIVEKRHIERYENENDELLKTTKFFNDIADSELVFEESGFPEITYIRNEIENLESRNSDFQTINENLKKELEDLRTKQKESMIHKELKGLTKNELAELNNIPNEINSLILSISTNELQLYAVKESIQIKQKELKAKRSEVLKIFAKGKLFEISESHKRAIKLSKQFAIELRHIEELNRLLIQTKLLPVGIAKPDYTTDLSEILGVASVYIGKSINYANKFNTMMENKKSN